MSSPGMSSDSEALSTPPVRSAVAATWALLLGVGLMMAGNSLQGTLIGVRSALDNFDTRAIGVLTAAYFAGFLVGGRIAFAALTKVGHIRVFAALASSASAVALLHAMFVDPFAWSVLRFFSGLCMAGMYVVAESWLNDEATNETRGLLLSGYLVVGLGGEVIGQALLNVAAPTSFKLFLVASILVSVSLVPITMSAKSVPPMIEPEPVSLSDLWQAAPTGILTLIISGMNIAALTGLVAVHAVLFGMPASRVSLLVATMTIGGVVAQLPVGAMSDRLPRRKVMLVAAAATALFATAMAMTDPDRLLALPLVFALGASSFPLYGLGAAHTNDWISSEQRAGAAMVMTVVSGGGAVVGPLLASLAMTQTEGGLFYTVAVINGAFALYLGVRILTRDPISEDEKSKFQPQLERAAVVGYSAEPEA